MTIQFFFISKCNCIKKAKKIHLKVYTKYTRLKGLKREGKHKKPPTYLHLNQLMKLSKDHELEPTLTLTQPKNMYKQDRKIAWSVSSVSSKALLFLSLHKDKINTMGLHSMLFSFSSQQKSHAN